MNVLVFKCCRYFCCSVLILLGIADLTAAESGTIKIVALGDSLTAGYQLPASDSFPSKLQNALLAKGQDVEIVNAGVSGDTTSDGLQRLDWSVPEDTDAVILELGANDALWGLDPQVARNSLEEIVRRLKERDVKVLICGMLAPPNFGSEYGNKFNSIFKEIADNYGTLYYPFFLEGVAAKPELNLSDGMHPNSKGVDVIVEGILPLVEQLIARVGNQS